MQKAGLQQQQRGGVHTRRGASPLLFRLLGRGGRRALPHPITTTTTTSCCCLLLLLLLGQGGAQVPGWEQYL